ncbi:hypothetical protein LXT21_08990 [Myxococcus sp. K38C18041901]|uniref:hypothetical protein n=1 Tax=Myxococcus guangdongensis TaxID=2906760 RepID=UPI0020A7CECE|nr:hypothetical protein [Myxococcus guangdongensis]MCP3058906.1 hypothetical protein [Myxococcus guangdongensis]
MLVVAFVWTLAGCAATPTQGTSSYRFDTVSNTCRQRPETCAALAGKEFTQTPGLTVATMGASAREALRVLERGEQERIEEALVRCAEQSRTEVLLAHRGDFAGQTPTREECKQMVRNASGRNLSRAMQLGMEMHAAAMSCAERALTSLRPGDYSLEPCYRHDAQTGGTKVVTEADVQALKQSGNGGELQGTLVPDVVIHAGHPAQAQAVYDFKFPCANVDEAPPWRKYPKGHCHQGFHQGEMYEQALGVRAVRIVPRLGIVR